jgi:hypothetical protein
VVISLQRGLRNAYAATAINLDNRNVRAPQPVIIVFEKHERLITAAHDHRIGPEPTLWRMQGCNFAGELLAGRHSARDS